jgi:hypothetical protein
MFYTLPREAILTPIPLWNGKPHVEASTRFVYTATWLQVLNSEVHILTRSPVLLRTIVMFWTTREAVLASCLGGTERGSTEYQRAKSQALSTECRVLTR